MWVSTIIDRFSAGSAEFFFNLLLKLIRQINQNKKRVHLMSSTIQDDEPNFAIRGT
jgi:hypothetical protein